MVKHKQIISVEFQLQVIKYIVIKQSDIAAINNDLLLKTYTESVCVYLYVAGALVASQHRIMLLRYIVYVIVVAMVMTSYGWQVIAAYGDMNRYTFHKRVESCFFVFVEVTVKYD